MLTLALKPHKEKSLLKHHPWVFAGALSEKNPHPASGETVDLISKDGRWLARGAFSPHSKISVRVWTFTRKEIVDSAFFYNRLKRSIERRRPFFNDDSTTAYRLVNSESDGLPGLIVDRYQDYLVIQSLAAGIESWKQEITKHLQELIPCEGIYERSDASIRQKEGLPVIKQVVSGRLPSEPVLIRENQIDLLVDIVNGHKTGFYLDQRENRKELMALAKGAIVLNCFCYTGGFALYALKGGASKVVNIDVSKTALNLARRNLELNRFNMEQVEMIEGDVFEHLRLFSEQHRKFDLIILDPPKFADSQAQLVNAAKGYKEINRLALRLLRSGGFLFTFSCSGLLDSQQFQQIITDAALDAGRSLLLVKRLDQAMDHPVLLTFPEGTYLKGMICQVD